MHLSRLTLAAVLLANPALAADPSPIVATPTAGNRAANKSYIDTLIAAVNSTLAGKSDPASVASAIAAAIAVPNDGQVYGRSGLGWAAFAGSGTASVTSSTVTTALGFTPANRSGDTFTGPVLNPRTINASPVGCATTDGHFTGNGISTWVPTCFGVFNATDPTLNKVNPTRGTVATNGDISAGNSTYYRAHLITPSLVQQKADGGLPYEQTGYTSNQDVVGGYYSQGAFDGSLTPDQAPNVVGFQALMQIRRGLNGEVPPTAWGLNFDMTVAPNAGPVQAYGVEGDLNNFDRDCKPGVCNRAWYFYGGTAAYPNLTFHYISNPSGASWAGTVTTSGNTFTLSSMDLSRSPQSTFTDAVTVILYAGSAYRVTCANNGTTCVADRSVGNSGTPGAFKAYSSQAHFGMFFQDNLDPDVTHSGGTQVQDVDFLMGDAARTIITANGHHQIGLDFTQDDMPYAALFKQNQDVCYNGVAACMSFSTGLNAWLFQSGPDQGSNVARISTGGDAYFNGSLAAGGSVSGSSFVLNQGNKIALKGGLDGLLYSGAGSNNFAFDMGGYRALTVVGGSPNSFNMSTSTSGFGAVLSVTSPVDANVSAVIKNKGNNGTVITNDTGSQCSILPGNPTLSCSSDERLKRDIVDTGPALPRLLDMRIRDYVMRATGEHRSGVIAQEIQKTHPEMVREDENGMLAVEAPNPWVLVKAIQELKADNDNLRREVRRLARKIR